MLYCSCPPAPVGVGDLLSSHRLKNSLASGDCAGSDSLYEERIECVSMASKCLSASVGDI